MCAPWRCRPCATAYCSILRLKPTASPLTSYCRLFSMITASPNILGLDAAFIQRLDRLALVARQKMRGQGAGSRRSLVTGSSVEFADYRTYAPGDDFRRVDWNVYARLERL